MADSFLGELSFNFTIIRMSGLSESFEVDD